MEHTGRYIPNNLKKYREMHGYKQEQVTHLLGIKSTNRLSRWEKGIVMPSAQNLFKLSILYHTLPNQLYADIFCDLQQRIVGRKKLFVSTHPSQNM